MSRFNTAEEELEFIKNNLPVHNEIQEGNFKVPLMVADRSYWECLKLSDNI